MDRPTATTTPLEQLIMPGTSQQVVRNYLSLCARAQEMDFGPLEEDFVVIDTETTGLSFRKCSLIEIAAVRVSGTEIVDTFQTFVKPKGSIPEEIVQLTGIRDTDVVDAPRPQDAVAALAEFVGGAPVLAHNATFDRTFVESVKGGHQVSSTWIDTLALSRIALPRLRSHSLADMAHAFGFTSVAHRAMADVEALVPLWHTMLAALLDMPSGILYSLAHLHEEVPWQYRPIFAYLAQVSHDSEDLNLSGIRSDLLSDYPSDTREDAAEKSDLLRPISQNQITEAFSDDGLVAQMYEAYERRPEQVAMAQQVCEAFDSSTHRVLEAGTGVGKSIAYLLPAALYAQKNHVCVGVATKTNALTDQLVSHELPALSEVLSDGLRFHSLKGFEHYPCLLHLVQAMERDLPEPASADKSNHSTTAYEDMLTGIAVTLTYAVQSPVGDIDTLGIRWKNVPRQMLTCTAQDCARIKCPFFSKLCFAHQARHMAAEADIVVTNHSLLLANVEAEGNILPPIRHWIVDEAHSFEDEARRQWARQVAAPEVRSIFERLGGLRTGAIHTLMDQAAGLEDATLIEGLLTKSAAEASHLQILFTQVFEAVSGLSALGASAGYDRSAIWIGEAQRERPEWGRVVEAGQECLLALEDCCGHLREAAEAIASSIHAPNADLGPELRALIDLKDNLKLVLSVADKSYVYAAHLQSGRRGIGTEALVAEKLCVADDIYSRWIIDMMSVVFTSATLSVANDFDHFATGVGLNLLPAGSYSCLHMDSSFDFDRNMSVVVCQDLAAPGTPSYIDELVDLLFDVHTAMSGSVLTLFTNRREMEQCYQALKPRLAERGLNLMMQERTTGVRQLRNKFIAERDLSLMALKSFWEGFDAAGDTLRCVVIPRLPFAMPTDPLSRERDAREPRAWWRYVLPDAVIEIKQAAGRLIRTASDTGVLVMADSRLLSKAYGKKFLKSLPTSSYTALEADHMAAYLNMWRSSHE